MKPVLKESGLSKYYLYSIVGEDEDGQFEVFRRYSDFYSLRQALFLRWPGVFIPAVPPKKTTGNMEQNFIEERRKFLEVFMQELARLKYLWYSSEVNVFIRSTNPDVEKVKYINNINIFFLKKIYHLIITYKSFSLYNRL